MICRLVMALGIPDFLAWVRAWCIPISQMHQDRCRTELIQLVTQKTKLLIEQEVRRSGFQQDIKPEHQVR